MRKRQTVDPVLCGPAVALPNGRNVHLPFDLTRQEEESEADPEEDGVGLGSELPG